MWTKQRTLLNEITCGCASEYLTKISPEKAPAYVFYETQDNHSRTALANRFGALLLLRARANIQGETCFNTIQLTKPQGKNKKKL